MAVSPDAAIEAVRARLRDIGTRVLLELDDIDTAVQRAVDEYSRDRPRVIVSLVEGDGTAFYPVSDIAGFVVDFSVVSEIEYPVVAMSESYRPKFLDASRDVRMHRTEDAVFLYLPYVKPSATESFRVHYTTPRTLTEDEDTILSTDKEALYDLAASIACVILMTEASSNQDATAPSDSTQYRDMASRFRDAAKEWRKSYTTHLNLTSGETGEARRRPGSAIVDIDTLGFGWGGRRYRWLTHGGRR